MNGERFLNELYKNLNLSDEVLHTSQGTHNKNEAVHKYMERLENSHSNANTLDRVKRLKNLYYKKYVINENDIPNGYNKDNIINAQKESLNKWLDYLSCDDARYPVWAKYWAFQGMLKIGTYNEATNSYQKRSKKTLSPFIEVNPEVLSNCIETIVKAVEGERISDDDLKQLIINDGNFPKLYTMLIKNNVREINTFGDKNDGVWKKYNYESVDDVCKKEKQGIETEYLRLYNDLQGYNTGWCTAGSKNIARDQICGVSSYDGGDFYVYYTKNKNGDYKIPRIAIRMENDCIGEIRGIEDNQNIENGLEDVVETKLKSMNLSDNQIKGYFKIISDMKVLTHLNKKNDRGEVFTKEDILFIYEVNNKIEGFGWGKDPRIAKIIKSHDFSCDFSHMKFSDAYSLVNSCGKLFSYVPRNIDGYKKMLLDVVRKSYFGLDYVPRCEITKDVALEAVRSHGSALFCVPGDIDGYSDIAMEAVKNDGLALHFVFKDTVGYKKIALTAVKNNIFALEYVSRDVKDYFDIILSIVNQNGLALQYVPIDIDNYKKVALVAAYNNGFALQFVPTNIKDYRKIVLVAVNQNGWALQFVPTSIKDYKKIAYIAVKNEGMALKFVPTDIKDYKKLVLTAIKNDGLALNFVSKKIDGYKDIALLAVKNDGMALEYVPNNVENYIEIVFEAIKNNPDALKYVSKDLDGYDDILKFAQAEAEELAFKHR